MPYVNGQFVDKRQLGTQTMGGPTQTDRVMSPQGDKMEALKTLLTIQGLSNMKNISKYSTALDMLEKISPRPKKTAEQVNREASLQPAVSILKQVRTAGHPEKNYFSSLYNSIALSEGSKLGGRGVPQEIQKASARYALLRQNVVRALNGARMSDQDIKLANEYIPTIYDTKENADAKLKVLEQMMNDISNGTYSFEDYSDKGSKSLTSDLSGISSWEEE